MNDFIMVNIFSLKNIVIYLLVINILGFFMMFIDKQKAKKKAWRIKEIDLFMVSVFGGSIGTICGMYLFRHKTKKNYFKIGLPLILIIEIIIAITVLT